MSMLNNLGTDSSVEQEKDSVGGGGFILDSGVYPFNIDLAYVSKSSGGAMALNLHLSNDEGQSSRQQLWMTSGDAKGNKNYYEKDGKKFYLPGFSQANAICLLTVGKEISKLDTENKVVKLYNFDEGKELPTEVPVITDLLNQKVAVGLIKRIVDKNVKDANGNYVPSGKTREINEIDKIFRAADGVTVTEIRAAGTDGKPEPTFLATWREKWDGQVDDRSTGTAAGTTSGAPAAASGGNAKPTEDLFG